MMSAKAISARIRAKKMRMEEDSGAVKLSGIPEDATDIEVNKGHEEGERLSENVPTEHDQDPSLETETRQEEMREPHMATIELVEDASHMAHGGCVGAECMGCDDPNCYAKGGDVLDANAREHIAPKNFALSGDRYPIEDIEHARNALARVAQHGTPEEQAEVRRKVHAKYPSLAAEHKADGGMMGERQSKIRSMLGRMRK